jgi:hypothetical protein
VLQLEIEIESGKDHIHYLLSNKCHFFFFYSFLLMFFVFFFFYRIIYNFLILNSSLHDIISMFYHVIKAIMIKEGIREGGPSRAIALLVR